MNKQKVGMKVLDPVRVHGLVPKLPHIAVELHPVAEVWLYDPGVFDREETLDPHVWFAVRQDAADYAENAE